jgi:hypothetical protein
MRSLDDGHRIIEQRARNRQCSTQRHKTRLPSHHLRVLKTSRTYHSLKLARGVDYTVRSAVYVRRHPNTVTNDRSAEGHWKFQVAGIGAQ